MKLLKVDLTNRKVTEEEIGQNLLEDWIGGRGLGAYLYSKDVRKPDDPQNSIFLIAGAITGTALPCSSRMEVVSSSPLTSFYQASNIGGYFGAYLKSQGIMGIQIKGQSKNWVYLTVEDGRVKIKDAKYSIAGSNVKKTQEKLRTNDNQSIACIGKAGENLVRFACVQFDNRAAGRTGTGWNFGFKKLKGVVVSKAKSPVKVNDTQALLSLNRKLREKRKKHEQENDFVTYCTPKYTDFASANFVYPAANYRRNSLTDKELDKIGYARFMEKVVGKQACWACPLSCTRITRSKFSDWKVKGPEYETIWALGASPEIFDLDVIIEATRLCEDFGLDTISTGATLAWYKECCDRGLVKENWSPERFLELIKQIGERKGIGNMLAEGSVKASKKIEGSEKFLAHAKGLEFPAWDPRGVWGMALSYVTGPTGGDHRKGNTARAEIARSDIRFSDLEKKVEKVIATQDLAVMIDSLGFCGFALFMLNWDILARCFNSVLGTNLTADRMKKRAKEIFNLEREINQKLGHKLEENTLPERIIDYEVKMRDKKIKLTKKNFEKMLEKYYKLRGWK